MRRIGLAAGLLAGLVAVGCGGKSPAAPEAKAGAAAEKANASVVGVLDYETMAARAGGAETVIRPANVAPTLVVKTHPTAAPGTPYPVISGRAPLTVTFNLCKSTDSDAGDSLNWQVNFGDSGVPAFNSDGSFNADSGKDCNVEHVYQAGTYTATVSVTDRVLVDQGNQVGALARTSTRFTVMASTKATASGPTPTVLPFVANGSLAAGDPTFNRPNGFSGPSGVGTAVYYDVYTLTALPAGNLTVDLTGDAPDTYLLMYQPSFDPANSSTNLVAYNDDSGGLTHSQFSGAFPGGDYIVVVTSFDNGDTFNYTLTVTSP